MSAICRGCGCTEYDPCILHTSAFSTAETCHWARPGLCSACVRPHTRKEGPQHDRRTNYPVRVIVWSNGMVMVFDYHGVQLGKLQGAIADVRAKGELAALLPEEQWKWRIWTGSAPGSASMEWQRGGRGRSPGSTV